MQLGQLEVIFFFFLSGSIFMLRVPTSSLQFPIETDCKCNEVEIASNKAQMQGGWKGARGWRWCLWH